MTELSGTLDGIGLPAIVRFLVGLKKTGCLHLTLQDWHGELYFDASRLTDASFGSRTGLAALDAMVSVLPGAEFAFDSQSPVREQVTIELSPEALDTHLDVLSARIAENLHTLPAADVVPVLVAQDDASDAGEPVPLDRGTLQTLTLVDGHRTVRDIVAQRGTFDVLWQVGNLVDVGLVRLDALPMPVEPTPFVPEVARPVPAASAMFAQPESPEPDAPPVAATESQGADPAEVRAEALVKCPRLGFEDDPSHAFSRPTRLHRCFAAGAPMPLSLDQQRELCLSEQFGTCPRLAAAVPMAPNSKPEQEPDDSRIVRLRFAARSRAAERPMPTGGAAPASATAAPTISSRPGRPPEPARLRALSTSALQPERTGPPTPLRARLQRFTDGGATIAVPEPAPVTESAPPVREPLQGPPPPPEPVADAALEGSPEPHIGTTERRIFNVPVGLIATAMTVLGVVAVIVYLIVPQSEGLFGDDSVDPSALPNTALIAAGTPVSAITPSKPSAVDSTTDQQPTAAAASSTAVAAQATPVPTAAAPQAASGRTLLDERFTGNDNGWPTNAQAQIASGAYRITPLRAGQFVAVGAPIKNLPADLVVSATFRKLGGPAGGGYGIIVRDQQGTARDGANQDGRYYVLEVGDKGEVGIWRRDADHWVDLLPWQHSDAVKTGSASNELTVRAIGNTLSLSVNGTEVATRTDGTFTGGSVGAFVGGDGNVVSLDHYLIQTP